MNAGDGPPHRLRRTSTAAANGPRRPSSNTGARQRLSGPNRITSRWATCTAARHCPPVPRRLLRVADLRGLRRAGQHPGRRPRGGHTRPPQPDHGPAGDRRPPAANRPRHRRRTRRPAPANSATRSCGSTSRNPPAPGYAKHSRGVAERARDPHRPGVRRGGEPGPAAPSTRPTDRQASCSPNTAPRWRRRHPGPGPVRQLHDHRHQSGSTPRSHRDRS